MMSSEDKPLPDSDDSSRICTVLAEYISERRRARIEEVIANRTYSVAPVIEGSINRGNVSAVLRSSEAFGFQRVHVVNSKEVFKNSSRTSQGAEKWLDVVEWESASPCIDELKSNGYSLLVTALLPDAIRFDEVEFNDKVALVFGNEVDGVSDEMIERADQILKIPMAGFVESFNISVAAAIAMSRIYSWRRARYGTSGDLTDQQLTDLRAQYYFLSVQRADKILERAK